MLGIDVLIFKLTNKLFYWTTYSSTKVATENIGRRGRMVFGKPDMKSVLDQEIKKFSGKLLLSGTLFHNLSVDQCLRRTVSADPTTRDACRSAALRRGPNVDYFEPEFQPPKVTQEIYTTHSKELLVV